MKRPRLRSALLTALVVIVAGLVWEYTAPPQIAGSTSYIITHGVSMEPRFHTGDLALVRPASQYRVGDIVAYHSSLLHVVVLHRIVAIDDGRYTFKGDHNHFLDPVHPTRSQIVGKLWLHIPHGGVILSVVHTPVMGAMLAAIVGLILVGLGSGNRRGRRRDRRGKRAARPASQGAGRVSAKDHDAGLAATLQGLLITAAAAVVIFLGITVVAFSSPAQQAKTHKITYAGSAHFSYSASAPVGPVYPAGVVHNGDPIFLNIVHRLRIRIDYRLTAPVRVTLHGTEQLVLELSGSGGWSRDIPLGAAKHFTGDHVVADTSVALAPIQALFAQIERLTDVPAAGDMITVAAKIHVRGRLANQSIDSTSSPATSFSVAATQLIPSVAATTGAAAGTAGAATPGPGSSGSVSTTIMVPSTVGLAGIAIGIRTLRWLAPVLLLAGLAVTLVLSALVVKSRAFSESARIQAKHGHLIVPISAGSDLGWPAIDVGDIKALVRLAQASGQLILHNHDDEADTFLVNDAGSVYRYQVQLPKVIWGDWTTPAEQLAA